MNSVQMNDEQPPAVTRKIQFDWRKDLEASRDLMRRDMDAYGYVLSWIENWRVQRDLPPGRETMEVWWRECAKKKGQPAWRLRQWKDAIVRYLNWLELCRKSGGTGRSIPERIKDAVHGAGARRGLALRTRQTYAGWVMRFGAYAGTESRVMDEAVARDWLSHLVDKEKVAFATQKQALNALVFFCHTDQVLHHNIFDILLR